MVIYNSEEITQASFSLIAYRFSAVWHHFGIKSEVYINCCASLYTLVLTTFRHIGEKGDVYVAVYNC